jgi:esterase
VPKTVKIHASVTGEGPNVILIHGLFGMGSNLGALARALRDRYRVHSVDLPNHGRSAWLVPADIPGMARALIAWMDQQEITSASLVGHSLGGKVAMEIALRQSERVDALVVADIAPVAYPEHHRNEFAALLAVDEAQCHSRAEARQIMAQYLTEDMVIQFLLMSLTRSPAGLYQWRFNLAEIIARYGAMRAAITPGETYGGPVLFIKGGDSNYIQDLHRDSTLSLFPSASMKVMPGCGHWLHSQQPRLFNAMVGRFFDN